MSGVLKSIGKAVKKVVGGVVKFVKKIAPVLITAAVVVAAVYTGGAALGYWGAGASTGVGAGTAALGTAGGTVGVGTGAATIESLGAAASAAPAAGTVVSGLGAAAPTAEAAAINAGTTALGGSSPGVAGAAGVPGQTVQQVSAADYLSKETAFNLGDVSAEAASVTLNANPAATSAEIAQSTTTALGSSDIIPAEAKKIASQMTNEAPAAGIPEAAKVPASAGANVGPSNLIGKTKVAAGKAMDFAGDHPYVTGTAMQVLGAWLKEPPPDPNAPPRAAFGVTPDGKISNPNGEMVDYKDSVYASPSFKQAAGVAPSPTAAAPVAAAPQEIDTARAPLGLIDPGAPVQLNPVAQAAPTAINPDQLNKGLIGGIRVTGTA